MSGQDEKLGIIETAKTQYRDLMQLLRSRNPADPYTLMPERLETAVRQYETLGAIRNSMNFQNALEQTWGEIGVDRTTKQEIEKIATRSTFMDDYWGQSPS